MLPHNAVSDFQRRFPLSRKKFWKKMLELLVPIVLLWIMLVVVFNAIAILSFGVSRVGDSPSLFSFSLIAIAALVLILLLFAWYVKVYIRTYRYDGNDSDFTTIRKGVFAPTEIHVQYRKIQDVYVDQDILDRIMGLYDVHIASATLGSMMEAHIDGVDAETADGLRNFFLEKIRRGGLESEVRVLSSDAPIRKSPDNLEKPIGLIWQNRIASDAFPIDDRWILLKILVGLEHVVGYAVIFCVYAFVPNRKGFVLSDTFGWDGSSFISWGMVLALAYLVAYVAYALWWRRCYFFEFMTDFIAVRSGVVSREELHVPYTTIQDVIVRQNFLERLMGVYTVVIQNASGGQVSMFSSSVIGVKIPGQTSEGAAKISQALREQVLSKRKPDSVGL